MGTSSLRSLLLAAIVLSNCITWTASRHHYTHNVNGHRSRHRRQGIGLFLPASYIIPGGEGSGAWGEWGEISPCSRTCGGGVASQKRICLEFGSDGQPRCTGGDTKYFSCQTQDCPEGAGDFRAEQCAEFNDKVFRDQKIYTWVPYTKGHNPCELNCMPRGERFYYRQREKVVDGTRCNEESFDVCVNGTCQVVGCDMMLGSNAREDKCRECRGNGTNCKTMEGLIDDQTELRRGYNDVLLIPQGATNIFIEEIKASNNYLALRGKEPPRYYLNGDYHIDFPRSLVIAGAVWRYERSQQGFPAPDKLRCIGPITESLYLSLLLQEDNVGVKYEYSIPSDLAPRPALRYDWVFDQFSPCSATCGGGFQMRTVSCRSRDDLAEVDENLCDTALKPATNQTCNTQACAPRWVEGPWSPCSKPCGEGGTRSREVHCEKIITNGLSFRFPSIVSDKECFELLGAKPNIYEECNQNATCPTWFTGPWKACNKLCGQGVQTRQVVCHTKTSGRVEVFDDGECADEKPPSEQACNMHPCTGIDFVLSDWSGCDSCLSTNRTRLAKCVTKEREVVEYSLCAYHPVPILEEPCDKAQLPTCELQWYATQWSKCSVECGKGIQTRRVFCGLYNGKSVEEVDDSRCDPELRYKDTKPCEVPKEKCPAKWFAGPWTECSKKCGGGEQTRHVVCLIGDQEVGSCSQTDIPDILQTCNLMPCNEDEVLPVDSKSTPIMDDEYYDYQDCEEDVEDEEVGAELEEYDSPVFAKNEYSTADDVTSSFITSEGSGFGSTIENESTLFPETFETTETSSITTEVSDSDTGISTSSDETSSIDIETSTAKLTEIYNTDTFEWETTESTGSDSITGMSTSFEETTTAKLAEISSTDTIEMGTTESTGSDNSSEMSSTSFEETSSAKDTEKYSTDTVEMGTMDSTGSDSSSMEITTTFEETTTTKTTEISSTDTVETGTTESIGSDNSESAVVDVTYSTTVGISETTEVSYTESTETVSTDATETFTTDTTGWESTEHISTSSKEMTEMSTDDNISTVTDSTIISTVKTDSTERATGSSYKDVSTTEFSTTISTEINEETDSSTTEKISDSTTIYSTTESTSDFSSTESKEQESSTVITSSTEESSSKESSTEESTTESGTSEVSTTVEAGATSTTELSSTESTERTSESTEYSTTSETISEFSTISSTQITETSEFSVTALTEYTESTTKEATETVTNLSSTTSTPTDYTTITAGFTKKMDWGTTVTELTVASKRHCKPRKMAKCLRSRHGCCPDKKTPATGPFDKGCPDPKTCNETKFGCCSDGVSPAAGPKNKGCPIINCNETLYGCCLSDNTTPAEGNDQEGCPKPVPPCQKSKYGCCADGNTEAKGLNKQGCPETETRKPETKSEGCFAAKYGCCADNNTEATGPDDTGCPCNITRFGCCPDGLSPAADKNMKGCVMSCNTTVYGCCPDGQTPAHGPEYEGCCLQTAYGCCPDNYKPAEGPHLEGCGCQFARYGCCPDNVTVARGANKEGCGCQYTQFGCCPDRHTEAQGPEFKGCDCSTYQFGCCPDGYTTAKGPNLQGCHCQQSDYGCCGDGETAAKGPNQFGCDCSNSKFGCCPDGVTEAKGEKFFNCTDVPENRQAACSLPTDRGSCRNFTVNWFYDVQYGGCSRFWYGGCEGNGNRFNSQAECEDICVQPAPKDACKLPRVRGSCSNPNNRWYYDSTREQCLQFEYGGCLGNANNFESRELCQKQCEPARIVDQCSLPIERGSCAGYYGRWGYNAELGRCEQFIWGGCEGNSNRFISEAACLQRCNPPGQPKHKDTCALPAVPGICANYTLRWYYDTSLTRCRQFYYGGCDGNENNFMTEEECEDRCVGPRSTPAAPTVEQVVKLPASNDFCFLEKDPGPCDRYETHWAYDPSRGACMPFEYGGCGGNTNNFDDRETCERYCSQTQDVCQLPVLIGPCTDWSLQWVYDTSIDSCRQFYYGGCEGNDNRFDTQEACEQRCQRQDRVPQPATAATTPSTTTTITTTITPSTPPFVVPEGCWVSPTLEQCVESGQVWFLDPSRSACVPHNNAPAGVTCRRRGTFASQEACERACGSFRDLDVCQYEKDPGPCEAIVPKVYFDKATGSCKPFVYGGCHGGPNRFSSVEECNEVCTSESDPCKQPNDPGNCEQYYVMWYYNQARDACDRFVYTGCGGNDNRFENEADCENRCRSRVTAGPQTIAATTSNAITTTTYLPPIQTEREECRTPISLEPCGETITTYYYDTRTGACLSGDFGACGYANNYRSEEECERQCGAFRNIDVCRAVLDPGTCFYSVDKVYWDAASGRCLNFTYSGCLGGANRFSSVQECEEVCGGTGPDNELVPSCQRIDEYCDRLRCVGHVERSRGADGCVHCTCAPVSTPPPTPVDCEPARIACAALTCDQVVNKAIGPDGCETCQCLNPCGNTTCAVGERCVYEPFISAITGEVSYPPECRPVKKSGWCPRMAAVNGSLCERECNDDADCRGIGKCCERGCQTICVSPLPTTLPPTTVPTTTYIPDVPRAPLANSETVPEVNVAEGGKATLRCLFHGNPPPRITWHRGEITIESDRERYRLLSDGALEIVSIYRNDSGVYICVGTNQLGSATQEVLLQVNVPVTTRILTDRTTVDAGTEVNIRCDVDGYPMPEVFWTKDSVRLEPTDRITPTEARLTIRNANINDSGEYGCHASNAISSHSASIRITVQGVYIPAQCSDNPFFANCELIVRSRFCNHRYYSRFCCKSCVEAGQLNPQEITMQADEPWRKK